ncbi:SCO6745 family protein [Streptacidiphilus albus]|uniref:SCO6745 family protein n=1 Tax=Streptacidiphilus albus TaxID=105425 RepID=UPI0005AAB7BB
MWTLFEPLHAVTYFAPQARAAFEQVGLRGFWRGYFAGRGAPLGPVGPGPVYAAFYGFARPMVERALPAVWQLADPAEALAARSSGARAALRDLLGDVDVAEAAGLCREAAEAADLTGRVLAAANAALPWPEDPLDVLWQAATVLREHRGDGHVASLLVAGLDGCESLVWRAALDNDRRLLQPARGWSDLEWEAAVSRLTARGWLHPDGRPTDVALAARVEIEAHTDALAAGPWQALDDTAVTRLQELLEPLAEAAIAVLPSPNPIGLSARGDVGRR